MAGRAKSQFKKIKNNKKLASAKKTAPVDESQIEPKEEVKLEEHKPRIVILGLPNCGKRHFLASLLISLIDDITWSVKSQREKSEVFYYQKCIKEYGWLLPDSSLSENIPEQHKPLESFDLTGSRAGTRFSHIIQIMPEDFLESESKALSLLTGVTGIFYLVDPISYIFEQNEISSKFHQFCPSEPRAEENLLLLIDYLRLLNK